MVKAGFIDCAHFLLSTKGIDLSYPLFIIVQAVVNIALVVDIENAAHVFEDEPRFSIHFDFANLVRLITKNL